MKFPWTRQPSLLPAFDTNSVSPGLPTPPVQHPAESLSLADRLGAEFMPRRVCCRCGQSRLQGQLLLHSGANGTDEWICSNCREQG